MANTVILVKCSDKVFGEILTIVKSPYSVIGKRDDCMFLNTEQIRSRQFAHQQNTAKIRAFQLNVIGSKSVRIMCTEKIRRRIFSVLTFSARSCITDSEVRAETVVNAEKRGTYLRIADYAALFTAEKPPPLK
jgi:hypothetical protein